MLELPYEILPRSFSTAHTFVLVGCMTSENESQFQREKDIFANMFHLTSEQVNSLLLTKIESNDRDSLNETCHLIKSYTGLHALLPAQLITRLHLANNAIEVLVVDTIVINEIKRKSLGEKQCEDNFLIAKDMHLIRGEAIVSLCVMEFIAYEVTRIFHHTSSSPPVVLL